MLGSSRIGELGLPRGTQNYSTPGTYSFTVPRGIFALNVDMAGAQGGGTTTGGKGGRVQAALPVTPGQVLQIIVGAQGGHPTGASNGGGTGTSGFDSTASPVSGFGGGGASDIRIGGTALANRKIVAGAGGGASGAATTAGGPGTGGAGGGLTGGAGTSPGSGTVNAGGGTQSAGGAGGQIGSYPDASIQHNSGANGALGVGGNAGTDTDGVNSFEPGGGGGGYYGGGGGLYEVSVSGGGGGGSSYTDPSATGVTHTQGYQTGNGYVNLWWV